MLRAWRLWFGLLGAPLAWALHLVVSYPVVPLACATGSAVILHAITIITALVAACAGVIAWQDFRSIDVRGDRAPGDAIQVNRKFLAGLGVSLSLFFLLVILVEGWPVTLQDSCSR
jgi:hypothetical protein